MLINTTVLWIILLFLVALILGGLALQVFLSCRERSWPGLVLPALSFLNSLGAVLGMAGYGVTGANRGNDWFSTGMVGFLFNIPTVILIAVYFACRRGRARKNELERMRAKDLE